MTDNRMHRNGIIILVVFFGLFYFLATYFLNFKITDNQVKLDPSINETVKEELTNSEYIYIINNLYSDLRILYDVVNNKFKVSQEDTLTIGEITYKKITNFDDVMNNIFTENGINKYLSDLDSYFAVTDNGVYIAGNLVSYQTYYFRGDDTNIYIIDTTDEKIEAIIYEKWTSNNTNTLATIDLVKVDNNWRVDNVTILTNK